MNPIFELCSLLLGKSFESLLEEFLEIEPLVCENFYKSKHLKYLKIRKTRKKYYIRYFKVLKY